MSYMFLFSPTTSSISHPLYLRNILSPEITNVYLPNTGCEVDLLPICMLFVGCGVPLNSGNKDSGHTIAL
jgi:hypothetical protein